MVWFLIAGELMRNEYVRESHKNKNDIVFAVHCVRL